MFIPDPGLFLTIPDSDPESRGTKKHWISDSDQQHSFEVPTVPLINPYNRDRYRRYQLSTQC